MSKILVQLYRSQVPNTFQLFGQIQDMLQIFLAVSKSFWNKLPFFDFDISFPYWHKYYFLKNRFVILTLNNAILTKKTFN
jgi:hypothetical protein